MGNLLKEALKGLCGTDHWSYAVLWKFALQNPKFLVWEECYYTPSVSTQVPDLDLSFLERKMMVENHVNIVGHGLVGEVVNFTGNHIWVLSESHSTKAYPPEILKDLSQQFSAGIQTVAVIPVLPDGVIQLGSYLSIPEDVRFVSDSVLFVTQLGHVPGALQRQSLVEKELALGMRALICPGLDTLCELSMMSAGSFSADGHQLCALPGCHVEIGISEPRKFYFSSDSKICNRFCRGSSCNSKPVLDTVSLSDNHHASVDGVVGSDCLINRIDNSNSSKIVCCSSVLMNNIEHKNERVQPQLDDDSFNIVGADFETNLFWNQYSNSPGDLDCEVSSSNGTDCLVDSVVSNVYPSIDQVLDDNVSCLTTLNGMSRQIEVSNYVEDAPLDIPEYLQNSGAYSPTSYVYNSWAKKGHKLKRGNILRPRPKEMNKANHRKRQKPGKSLQPRPKDRQMIQDRLKELRKLVPNGVKCSIDALLERTTKHMLFLQRVEKHKDKLNHISESKIPRKDDDLPSKEGFNGGATRACEVGSKSMFCPIIIKDLNKPHQMLVEMLCDERGLFWEASNVLRGLGLTILKRGMETWNDKIQARFTIEVHRQITRVEIFLSLTRLLEKSSNVHSLYPRTQ